MVSFIIELIISETMFFLGVYGAISVQKAAQRFVATRHTVDQSNVLTSPQRAKSLSPFVIAFLVGLIVLPHIPTSYINAASLSFTAGMVFTTIVFIFQKIRVSFS